MNIVLIVSTAITMRASEDLEPGYAESLRRLMLNPRVPRFS
jgi:hypothetical protein